MSYLTPVVAILSISLLFNGCTAIGDDKNPAIIAAQKLVTINDCKCNNLQCNCCTGIELTDSIHHEFCFNVILIPNEITVKATVTIDGRNIYTGQIDPSVAPICPPALTGICLVINHVDIQKRQICAKLTASVITLVKFPCIEQGQKGLPAIQTNMYP